VYNVAIWVMLASSAEASLLARGRVQNDLKMLHDLIEIFLGASPPVRRLLKD
jgi:hypothetical protein